MEIERHLWFVCPYGPKRSLKISLPKPELKNKSLRDLVPQLIESFGQKFTLRAFTLVLEFDFLNNRQPEDYFLDRMLSYYDNIFPFYVEIPFLLEVRDKNGVTRVMSYMPEWRVGDLWDQPPLNELLIPPSHRKLTWDNKKLNDDETLARFAGMKLPTLKCSNYLWGPDSKVRPLAKNRASLNVNPACISDGWTTRFSIYSQAQKYGSNSQNHGSNNQKYTSNKFD